ncbi:uncharacterized protein [Aristolochia californica]|uniref:uncharacterized protein isoform X2 n=1 Tax=Aristolochia californica TaxID=171875 RepID=UPI0035D9A7CA
MERMMNHPPGHHGVHLCHKCGWSFPNPHPNAKHRRAHKKVCGKIEGFKIVDSEENSERSHLTVPKNDLSDDDRMSPESTEEGLKDDKKVEVERQVSNRSEDEVFADAVSEFTDAGSSAVTEPIAVGHPEDTDNAEPGQVVLNTPIANKRLQLSSPTCDDQFWSPDSLSSSPEKKIQSAATLNQSDKLSAGLFLTKECNEETKSFANVSVDTVNMETCENFAVPKKEHMPTTTTLPSTPVSEFSEMVCNVNEKDRSAKAEVHSDLPPACAIRVTTASFEGAFADLKDQGNQSSSFGHQYLLTEPSISPSMATVSSRFQPGFIEAENSSEISQNCIQIDSKHEVDLGDRSTDGVILAQDCTKIDPKHEVDPEDKVPYGGILTQDFTEFCSEHEVNPEDEVPDGGILVQDCIQLGPKDVAVPGDEVPDIRSEIDKKEVNSITSIGEESSEIPLELKKSPNGFSSSISSNYVEAASCDSSAFVDHAQVLEGPQVDSAQEGEAVSQFVATESCLQVDIGQVGPEFQVISNLIRDTAQAPDGMVQFDSAGQVAADKDVSKNRPFVCEEQGPMDPGAYVVSGGLGEATKADLKATLLHLVQEGVCEADGTLEKNIQEESVDNDQNGVSKDQSDDNSEAVSSALTERATEDQKTTVNGECAASNDKIPPLRVEEDVCKLDGTLVKGIVGESTQTCISKDHTDEKLKADSGETSGRATDDKEATLRSEHFWLRKGTPLVQVENVSKVDGILRESIQEESVCSDQSCFVKDHMVVNSEVDSSITSERAKDNEITTVNGECIGSSKLNAEVHEVDSVFQGRAIPEVLLVSCVGKLSETGTEVGEEEQSMEEESDVICAGIGEPREAKVAMTVQMQEDIGEVDGTTGPIMWEESLQKDHSHSTKDYLSENILSNLNSSTERTSKDNKTIIPAEYIGSTNLGCELHDTFYEKAQADLGYSVGAYVPRGDEHRSTLSENNTSSEFVNKSSGTEIEHHGDLGQGEAKVNPQPNESTPLDTIMTSEGASSSSYLFNNVSEPFAHQHQRREVSQENLHELIFGNSMEPSVVEPGIQVDCKNEEIVSSKVDTDSCAHGVVTEKGYGSKDLSEGNHFSLERCGDTIPKQNANASVVVGDTSLDSMSQDDSVEGTWGSSSDRPGVNLETPKEEASAAHFKKESNSDEGQLDNNDVFGPPSFMTLVDPRGNVSKQQASSSTEIQLDENSQKPTSPPSPPGWFPSLVVGSYEAQGRKKNEEIIAKVVNWSSGQPHTPLRSLLVEANAQKNQHPQMVPTSREHEPPPQDHDGSVGKRNSELPEPKPIIKGVMETDWNSPARLPISKREKRKMRGKAYWASFVCCSSVS